MSSKIEQLIDEIEDYIENCKPKFMSSTDIIVNKDEIDELLRELRMKTPEEIKHYQKIISNKEAILADARAKAESLIKEATIQTNELINEHEIMQQAYAQAGEIVKMATNQAQEILDQAAMEANAMRQAAVEYTDAQLRDLEYKLSHAVDVAALNYDKLISQLNEDLAAISANRAQLYPQEDTSDMPEDLEDVLTENLDALTS